MTDLALLVSRFLHLAPLIQALGGLVFLLILSPPGIRGRAAVLRLTRIGLAAALVGGLLWLLAQTVAMAGGAALGLVLTETHFGRVFALRFLLLLAAAALLRGRSPRLGGAAGCTAAALLLNPWLGHGAAAETVWLPPATAAHTLAASLWLGALVPLWLTVRADPLAGAAVARRFSRFGIACVSILAVTAILQAPLIGDLPRLIGTPYGGLVGAKLLLFAALLAVAALNRFCFTVQAATDGGRGLRASLAFETGLALLALGTAAGLASQPPAVHAQPVWPFALRPVPTLWEDAFLRDRIIRTLVPLGGAVLLAAGAFLWRRGRWLLAGAALAALFWVPDFPLKPYVRPAYPTSFQNWERARSPASLQESQTQFLASCAPCHAADARGRGPQATGVPVWPPDLTAPLYRRARDGDLFWRIKAGTHLPDGTPTMPGFGERLTADSLWGLVDYLRARGSARSFEADGRWAAPPRAPTLIVQCRTPGSAAEAEADPAHPAGALLYLDTAATAGDRLARLAAETRPPEGGDVRFCRIADPDLRAHWRAALALLTEGEAAAFDGSTQLIDGQGWLRRTWRSPPGAGDLAAEAAAVLATPVTVTGGHHN